jgi:hypothetical protein
MTMHRALFLIGGIVDPVEDDDATLRIVYDEHRGYVWRDCRPYEVPFGFWFADRRVPDHLRATRAEAGAVAPGPESVAVREALDGERTEWLRERYDRDQPHGGLA